MRKFLDGRHNNLVWVHLSADPRPEEELAGRFAKSPRLMKARPIREYGVGGKEHPAYFLLMFGYNFSLWQASPGWPSAEGRVSYIYSGGDKIDYEYTVDGIFRTGTRVSFANEPAGDRWAEGEAVNVYYAPGNPYQCTLIRGGSFSTDYLVCLGLGILFIGIGYIAFRWGVGRYETVIDPVYWT